ncbi:MAG: hypothetical protein IPK63_18905 [Candidatus Competibacteraceae bacterium]|nr:hypothetical protein [Candidatus Competibacteraceae bacterium]
MNAKQAAQELARAIPGQRFINTQGFYDRYCKSIGKRPTTKWELNETGSRCYLTLEVCGEFFKEGSLTRELKKILN